jgi:hypothetical protein
MCIEEIYVVTLPTAVIRTVNFDITILAPAAFQCHKKIIDFIRHEQSNYW